MSEPVVVNDVHSELNATRVVRVVEPGSAAEVAAEVRSAAAAGKQVSICGARHAMGGQQFGAGTVLMDLRRLDSVGPVDRDGGTVECGAGVMWPGLIAELHRQQRPGAGSWSIRQKQTGADRLTLGGALAANVHGRGLRMRPIIDDVERFVIVGPDGALLHCSRTENAGLFRLVIGGYGCLGPVVSVTLRLARRRKLERIVDVIDLTDLMPALAQRIAGGFRFGDFQFAIDERSPDFLRRGVFSCYREVEDDRAIPGTQRELQPADWERLIVLAHTDRARAFEEYARHYLATSGQIYWTDTHQLSPYFDGYHRALDSRLGTGPASEMISELYVPRSRLVAFMQSAAAALRPRAVPVIYGTIRLIERDEESFLAWAREDWACIIFNLHVEHTPGGIDRAAEAFRALIDAALELGGTYYLTYHRWARADQIRTAYPQFTEFLRQKERHDPHLLFQSDWWRHSRSIVG